MQAEPQPKKSKAARNVFLGLFGFVALFYGSCAGLMYLVQLVPEPAKKSDNGINHSRSDAYDVTKRFVSNRLKAPATADFAAIDADGHGLRRTATLGALRSRAMSMRRTLSGRSFVTWYLCTVRSTGGKNFRLEDLTVFK